MSFMCHHTSGSTVLYFQHRSLNYFNMWGKLADTQCFTNWNDRTWGRHNECATWDLSVLKTYRFQKSRLHTGIKMEIGIQHMRAQSHICNSSGLDPSLKLSLSSYPWWCPYGGGRAGYCQSLECDRDRLPRVFVHLCTLCNYSLPPLYIPVTQYKHC